MQDLGSASQGATDRRPERHELLIGETHKCLSSRCERRPITRQHMQPALPELGVAPGIGVAQFFGKPHALLGGTLCALGKAEKPVGDGHVHERRNPDIVPILQGALCVGPRIVAFPSHEGVPSRRTEFAQHVLRHRGRAMGHAECHRIPLPLRPFDHLRRDGHCILKLRPIPAGYEQPIEDGELPGVISA